MASALLDFTLRDVPGWVEVTVGPNEDPEAVGKPRWARGFPVCTATVTCRGRGYLAALGWIQLVRSSDNASGGEQFELDPFEPLGTQAHPFCFFGFAPTLFDAPSRGSFADLDWLAHSFLCFITAGGRAQEAHAVLGFSWGCRIRDQVVSYDGPSTLTASAWDAHLALLGRSHPTWDFAAGFHSR
jgi:hypothetical protein